jgi:16S rRNA processing protein RimM
MGRVPVGRVVSVHGLKGEVKFSYYNEVKDSFFQYTSFLAEDDDRQILLKPIDARLGKGFFYIRFEGFESPENVSFLVNKELFVREEDLPRLNDDEYYDYTLIGLVVLNQRHEKIGKVEEILHTKAYDIMVVNKKTELLIPMVDTYILEINLDNAFVKVDEDALAV